MSQHCTKGIKGTVILSLNGELKERIVIDECPLTIESQGSGEELLGYSGQIGIPCYQHPSWLNPISPAVWIWSSYLASPKQNGIETASFSYTFNLKKENTLRLYVAVDNIAKIYFNGVYVGETIDFTKTVGFVLQGKLGSNTIKFDCENVSSGITDPRGNPGGLYFQLYSSPGCKLKISSSSSVVYNNEFEKCPIYEVVCGDDCPKGQIKCEQLGYPGYCCLDCASLKSEIRNVTQAIRDKISG